MATWWYINMTCLPTAFVCVFSLSILLTYKYKINRNRQVVMTVFDVLHRLPFSAANLLIAPSLANFVCPVNFTETFVFWQTLCGELQMTGTFGRMSVGIDLF